MLPLRQRNSGSARSRSARSRLGRRRSACERYWAARAARRGDRSRFARPRHCVSQLTCQPAFVPRRPAAARRADAPAPRSGIAGGPLGLAQGQERVAGGDRPRCWHRLLLRLHLRQRRHGLGRRRGHAARQHRGRGGRRPEREAGASPKRRYLPFSARPPVRQLSAQHSSHAAPAHDLPARSRASDAPALLAPCSAWRGRCWGRTRRWRTPTRRR